MAGLPKHTTELIENDRVSFLRRSRQRHLGLIANADIEDAFLRTIEEGGMNIDFDALELMVNASGGFAYMMQLVGYYSWSAASQTDTITINDAERGIKRARAEFETGVLENTYREMSAGDRAFARAMLPDLTGSTLTDVARRMGKGTNYASTYKTRLMRQGVISDRAGKSFDFDIPGFRDYLAKLR